MTSSDILYLIFASIALIILCFYLVYLYYDDMKKQIIKEQRYNCIISLLEKIERNSDNEK